jgi:divalent metal cation (Fe/Co/Zn/Cd) transporter
MAGILVTAMIGLTGMEIFLSSMNDLTDTVDTEAVGAVRGIADSVEGVIEASNVRARRCVCVCVLCVCGYVCV